jgi:ATP-binding cassette subfamily B multidrug efflux pump
VFTFFEKLLEPFPTQIATRPPATLFSFCLHYTRGVWPWLFLMAFLVAVVSVLEVLLFGFLGNLVDWLTNADKNSFLKNEGSNLFWMAVIIVVVLPLVSAIYSIVMHQTVLGNYPMRIRWLAHRYLLHQSFGFYQDEFAGRIATKVMQTALGVRETIMTVVDVIVYVGVYFIGALILMGSFNFWLMLPFLAWLALYTALLSYFLPRLRKVSALQADARSTMTGRVVDSYTNIMTVKLFAHAGHEEQYAKDSMEDFMTTVYRMMRLSSRLGISVNFLNGLLLFSVGFVSLWAWLNELVTIGAITVGVALVLRLKGMAHWIMWQLSTLFENLGMAQDGMGTIARVHTVTDIENANDLDVTNGRIVFENMRFHYGKSSGVIDDFSLEIQAGEKVGIVGRSGAGKSTLMNVLLRLFNLESGRILIDGQDISLVTQESLRSKIGVVTQDTSLLHRSVGSNIAYGRHQATLQEIIQASKRANAHEFILNLTDMAGRKAYDAHVGERGVKLSGGQRQRIAIARMFLKDAPILVLDEATSSLDSEVEAAIQENLMQLIEGKTVIAIAHRLSTISALDRLVVIEQGKIIQQGTHQQLADVEGLYAELWQRQSGGFIA